MGVKKAQNFYVFTEVGANLAVSNVGAEISAWNHSIFALLKSVFTVSVVLIFALSSLRRKFHQKQKKVSTVLLLIRKFYQKPNFNLNIVPGLNLLKLLHTRGVSSNLCSQSLKEKLV